MLVTFFRQLIRFKVTTRVVNNIFIDVVLASIIKLLVLQCFKIQNIPYIFRLVDTNMIKADGNIAENERSRCTSFIRRVKK